MATVSLPPLRERTDDILPLAQHFIGVYGARLGLKDATISDDAEAALRRYIWPGNIRELEYVIHFALIVCRQGVVRAADLRLVPIHAQPVPSASALELIDLPIAELVSPAQRRLLDALEVLLDEASSKKLFLNVEGALVRAAFERVGENQVKAARVLGVTRNTLRTLLKRHGMLSDSLTSRSRADSAAVTAPLSH